MKYCYFHILQNIFQAKVMAIIIFPSRKDNSLAYFARYILVINAALFLLYLLT